MNPAVRAVLALDRALTGLAVAAAVALLALAVAVGFFQVFTRFVLAEPSTWSEVLVRTTLIWMVYLGAAGAFRQGALVSVDTLYNLTRGRARAALELVITLASLTLLGILVRWGWDMALRVRFQNLAGLEVSIAWGYAAIPVGAAFAMVAVVAHHFDPVRRELETAQ